MSNIGYRPDIDGLRAIAVGTVVLYHFKTGIFRGGFVGVDVFFVISGYLITSIIAAEMEKGTFSFRRFYERRIRRIFPALFAMLVATSVFASVFLYPEELKEFGTSVISTLTFVSNFYFYTFRGYFRSDVELKPLLHTWSLAVEEQFYLVFPLLLFVIYRYFRTWTVPTVVVLGLLSFLGSVWLVKTNTTAAFYFSPPRFWEMMAGAVIAISGIPAPRNRPLREVLACVGLGLVLLSALFYKPMMPFPGLYAAAPVIGAAMIIYICKGGETFVSKLLALKPISFVGLLSYSLYLWHWPVAVFYHLKMERPLEVADSVILIPMTFALAYLSWKFVEQPLRRPQVFGGARLWSVNFALSAFGIVFGLSLWWSGGLPQRLSPGVDRLAAYINYDDTATYRRGTCFLDGELQTEKDFRKDQCMNYAEGKPNYLLIGDSHGAHLWNGLHATMRDVNLMQATSSGCKPLIHGSGLKNCRQFIEGIYQGLQTRKPDAVILSARWVEKDIPDLVASVKTLNEAGIKVYVLGPVVEYDLPLARLLADHARSSDQGAEIPNKRDEIRLTDQAIGSALEGQSATTYLSVLDAVCPPPSGKCRTLASNDVPLQWDYGHFTREGALAIAQRIVAKLLP